MQAAKGPTSGDLNVKAFEQQLQAVQELMTAPAMSAVLAPTFSQTQDGNLVKDVVSAQVRSLDSLLSSYCDAQYQVRLLLLIALHHHCQCMDFHEIMNLEAFQGRKSGLWIETMT